MPGINNLQNVNIRELVSKNQAQQTNKAKLADDVNPRDFGQTITDFISAVNEDQKISAKEVSNVIEGKSENLHQAMAAMEEASLSFRLMVEVRNKLMESYQTLQRMQV